MNEKINSIKERLAEQLMRHTSMTFYGAQMDSSAKYLYALEEMIRLVFREEMSNSAQGEKP
jgi:hypothetical protein